MNQAIQYMVDYVEGRLDISEFKKLLKTDQELKKELRKKFDLNYSAYSPYNNNVFDYITRHNRFQGSDWDNITNRYIIYMEFKRWLDWFHVPYNASFLKYEDDYEYILNIQPSWLDCADDQGIFERIIAETPQELSKSKRIQWGKSKIKELFRYDKTYPHWIQSPEWPIVNGKPLVFSHQKKAGKDDARTFYYFYDPDTGEETVVTQFY